MRCATRRSKGRGEAQADGRAIANRTGKQMNDAIDHTKAVADYYDSADANAFYAEIWGGEDIHIGLYADDADDDIAGADRIVSAGG